MTVRERGLLGLVADGMEEIRAQLLALADVSEEHEMGLKVMAGWQASLLAVLAQVRTGQAEDDGA